ncbi:MAG: transporter [Nocardioidaceae bacterium]|jgi:hypothetical protein|nr:transporter [Nocardioidaceae bacterium]
MASTQLRETKVRKKFGKSVVLQTYRRVLSVPGAAAFSGAGLLARLPFSMTGLGIVLLVSDRTGSYGTAGALAAAYVVAEACGQPVVGRLVDRHGQARVVLPVLVVFAAGTTLLCVGVELGWSRPWWFAGATLAGASYPPWGSLVRARWVHALLRRRSLLPTAFAIEAVVDEAVFVIGPVLVTALVTAVHPSAGVVAAAVLGTVGGVLLVAQVRTAPPVRPRRSPGDVAPAMGWATLAPLAVASAGLGIFFGGAEVATVAFAEAAGSRGDAGWMLALWATGSLLAGIAVGALPAVDPLLQFRVGALALTATMATAMLAGSSGGLALCLFASGLAVSPTLIAAMALVEQTVPSSRLTEGMTWATTGLAIGVAPGAAGAGATIDAAGATLAFLVPVAGGGLAALLAWTIRPTPARRIGSDGAGDHTVDKSSAPVRADPRRQPDA